MTPASAAVFTGAGAPHSGPDRQTYSSVLGLDAALACPAIEFDTVCDISDERQPISIVRCDWYANSKLSVPQERDVLYCDAIGGDNVKRLLPRACLFDLPQLGS
jgi:hypothetical protein